MTDATARTGAVGPGAGPASGPGSSAGFLVSQLGFAISRRFGKVLEPLGLEPRQFALLRYVAAAEGHSQQELGAVLQVPASRMVALLDEMEERGLLERRPHPTDRRAKALYLTPGGRTTLTQAMEAAAAFEGEVTAGLSADERQKLVSLLQRLAANLELTFGVHPGFAAQEREMGPDPPDHGCARP